MPLIDVRQLAPTARLGLWRMEESPALGGLSPRQRERQAVHQLLWAMTGDETLHIDHEASGKPVLPGMQLSVSHTRGYAALLLAESGLPGVDIEFRSDRVERIASRFIAPGEPVATTLQKLLLWSAKETVYKMFSADRLQFFDMCLLHMGEETMTIENRKRGICVEVHHECTADFVLTYSLLP